MKHMLAALLSQYESTKDTILAQQNMAYNQALNLLESHEARIQTNQGTAMFAGKQQESQYTCFLYNGSYSIRDYPHLKGARKTIKAKQSRRKSLTSSIQKRGTLLDKDYLKKMVKMLIKEVQELKV